MRAHKSTFNSIPTKQQGYFCARKKDNAQMTETPEKMPRPRGRPKVLTTGSVNVNLRMTPAQREKLEQLGGAAWIREQIDKAELPPQS